jgi:predicted RNA-binding protein
MQIKRISVISQLLKSLDSIKSKLQKADALVNECTSKNLYPFAEMERINLVDIEPLYDKIRNLDRLDESDTLFGKIIKLDNDNKKANFQLGGIYEKKG